MKIFIAHSSSEVDTSLAYDIASWLRAQGHIAHSGDEIFNTPHMHFFSWISLRDELIREFVSSADVLIAIYLDGDTSRQNVSYEIGYYLRQPHAHKVLIVGDPSVEIPLYHQGEEYHFVPFAPARRTEFFGELRVQLEVFQTMHRRRRRQLFLSYSKNDLPQVKPLYEWLIIKGYRVWFDEVNLITGDDWDLRIVRAIRDSVAFIACFSLKSVNKVGYFQTELRRSLVVASEYPEGSIFILPVRLDECDVPSSFKKYHWCDLGAEGGYDRLERAIEKAIDDFETLTE